jgi:hypothetical protein
MERREEERRRGEKGRRGSKRAHSTHTGTGAQQMSTLTQHLTPLQVGRQSSTLGCREVSGATNAPRGAAYTPAGSARCCSSHQRLRFTSRRVVQSPLKAHIQSQSQGGG